MSNFDDLVNMNLHEECLLKYLVNPLELFYTTELLKNNNSLIEKVFAGEKDIDIIKNGKPELERY